LFYPDWFVYDDYNVSVEKSTFTIITPNEIQIQVYGKVISKTGSQLIKERIKQHILGKQKTCLP